MLRKARLDVSGTLHHVMVLGIEGSKIFRDEEDRKTFIERPRSLFMGTESRILAWALIENHLHLLVVSGPGGTPGVAMAIKGIEADNKFE